MLEGLFFLGFGWFLTVCHTKTNSSFHTRANIKIITNMMNMMNMMMKMKLMVKQIKLFISVLYVFLFVQNVTPFVPNMTLFSITIEVQLYS